MWNFYCVFRFLRYNDILKSVIKQMVKDHWKGERELILFFFFYKWKSKSFFSVAMFKVIQLQSGFQLEYDLSGYFYHFTLQLS